MCSLFEDIFGVIDFGERLSKTEVSRLLLKQRVISPKEGWRDSFSALYAKSSMNCEQFSDLRI